MSRRFGLLIDPLDMTGLCGSLCEPYWLVTVSGFQGSSCSGFPAYPAVLPAACRLSCVRRQGDTIRTRPEAVNGLSELFSIAISAGSELGSRETRTPSETLPEGVRASQNRIAAVSCLAMVSSSDPNYWFSTHAPVSKATLSGAVSYCTSARILTQGLERCSLYLPGDRETTTRHGLTVTVRAHRCQSRPSAL